MRLAEGLLVELGRPLAFGLRPDYLSCSNSDAETKTGAIPGIKSGGGYDSLSLPLSLSIANSLRSEASHTCSVTRDLLVAVGPSIPQVDPWIFCR